MGNKNNADLYLFHNGTNYCSYNYFAPHRATVKGKNGWQFRVYAPAARAVSVVGDFNGWDRSAHKMRLADGGVWELFIPALKVYDIYKYAVEGADGKVVLKCDPYALHTETAPATAAKLYDLAAFKWTDSKWLERRNSYQPLSSPINIYEVHLGSWRVNEDGNPFSYRQLADTLVDYVKKMNYTHVELMPVSEFPFDGSWGYQVTGMFAPTSRYGSPKDFQYFVNKCHAAGIGVILDWVGAHFPKDAHGLYRFDGTCLYEYSDTFKQEHKGWGTVIYDYAKTEVISYLMSSAYFWIKEYHIDGLRADAVAGMLYLDYDRKQGEWRPNSEGGNINLEAKAFLQAMNNAITTNFRGVITCAEESTSFPAITRPVSEGGLGFTFKWNMGWMNDTLCYAKADPYFRQHMHDKLTFSFTYAYAENYILPFSHDEVVHGKCSMLSKMPGFFNDKFAALKAFLGYQMSFVGKKLSFMGNEIAQVIEWNYKRELDWFLLTYPLHDDHRRFTSDINAFYKNTPALYESDARFDGFEWLVVDDNTQNIIVYRRIANNGDYVICIMNFSPIGRDDYRFGVPNKGVYNMALSSDDLIYGGSGVKQQKLTARKGEMHGKQQYISLYIPPNSVQFLTKKAVKLKEK